MSKSEQINCGGCFTDGEEETPAPTWVISTGSVEFGFKFFGPFDSAEEAQQVGTKNRAMLSAGWGVVRVQTPQEIND